MPNSVLAKATKTSDPTVQIHLLLKLASTVRILHGHINVPLFYSSVLILYLCPSLAISPYLFLSWSPLREFVENYVKNALSPYTTFNNGKP